MGMIESTTIESRAFRETKVPITRLLDEAASIERGFVWGTVWLGAFVGLAFGVELLRLSGWRARLDYEADPFACVNCARCYADCPRELVRLLPAAEADVPCYADMLRAPDVLSAQDANSEGKVSTARLLKIPEDKLARLRDACLAPSAGLTQIFRANRSALRFALVLSLIAFFAGIGALGFVYFSNMAPNPQKTSAMEKLQAEFAEQPEREGLRGEIRQLHLKQRQEFHARQWRIDKLAYVTIFSALAAILCAKALLAASLKPLDAAKKLLPPLTLRDRAKEKGAIIFAAVIVLFAAWLTITLPIVSRVFGAPASVRCHRETDASS
jgi:ferredoxin